jgi:hypothetical protein
MANKNDEQIRRLLQSIEEKKIQIGTKPKASWLTNGVIEERNINTITTVSDCIAIVSKLIGKKEACINACKFLEVLDDFDYIEGINNSLSDLKLRTQMIKWDIEKKKLNALETQLKNLRSADAKTEDELENIIKTLS